MTRDQFIINRVNQPPFIINRGDIVKVMINRDTWREGKVEGISQAKKQIKVGGLWYDYGFVYPAPPVIETVKKTTAKLSSVVKRVNNKNTPPGGWGESDRVII